MNETLRSAGLLLLRLVFGGCMAYHGFQKIFEGSMPMFAEAVDKMGFPMPIFFAWAAALSEFLGGLLVFMGLKIRVAASFIAITMGVAFFITHRLDAFQVKELALAYLAISVMYILVGAGKFSLDRL